MTQDIEDKLGLAAGGGKTVGRRARFPGAATLPLLLARLMLATLALASALALAGDIPAIPAEKENTMAYVRWSELQIDPAQRERFTALAADNIRQTRLAEPGVLAFYAAAEKEHPNSIRVLEVYADANAYQHHLQTPHFQQFRSATARMVADRKLFETIPVKLGAKPSAAPATAVVRIAELDIAPSRLASYQAAVTEEIEASIRVEPGVLAIYALALKEQPNRLRFFEIYADEQAYQQHRVTPHFQKYLEVTRGAITSIRLIETAPFAAVPQDKTAP